MEEGDLLEVTPGELCDPVDPTAPPQRTLSLALVVPPRSALASPAGRKARPLDFHFEGGAGSCFTVGFPSKYDQETSAQICHLFSFLGFINSDDPFSLKYMSQAPQKESCVPR